MEEKKLTEKLIDFALNFKTEDIPAEVMAFQKKVLVDSIGVMTAATTLEPACKPFMEYAIENNANPVSAIIGTDQKTSPVMAAMANGALIHALDYEDGHDVSHAHPNTASIPSLLAIAQSKHSSGKELVAAMVISSEIAVRLKMCLTGNDLRDCGWYSPPMFACYGAVLGASRLAGLDEMQTLDALSIAMTQISLPGQSARSKASVLRGVREALSAKAAAFGVAMAEKGVHARMDDPFEGEFGLFMSCFRNMYDENVIFDELGTRWEATGLRFKAWPCCGTTHGVIDDLFGLLEENDIKPEEINEIHLTVNKVHMNLLEPYDVKYHPQSLAAAKFSLPFTVALATMNRNVTLNMYKEEILSDPKLIALAEKVTFELRPVDPAWPKDLFLDDFVKVNVKTGRGDFEREITVSSGSPKKPLTDAQIKNKFFDCMTFGAKKYDQERISKIFDEIYGLDSAGSVDTLFALLCN